MMIYLLFFFSFTDRIEGINMEILENIKKTIGIRNTIQEEILQIEKILNFLIITKLNEKQYESIENILQLIKKIKTKI
jgi:hypothetical protein